MDQGARLLGFDLPHAAKSLMYVGHENHFGAQFLALGDTSRAGVLRHHHLGADAEQFRRVGNGNRMITRTHGDHAVTSRRRIQRLGAIERTPQLEGPGALK
jgi:hypothetical protein